MRHQNMRLRKTRLGKTWLGNTRLRGMAACVLAVGLGFGAANLARADDDAPPRPSGNWLTRLFKRQPATPPPAATKPDEKKAPAVQADSASVRVQAQMDLMRRQEVCDKLREIALTSGDEELRRKADQLDQRAWEAYLQKVGRGAGSRTGPSLDENVMEQNGLGAGSRQPPNPMASNTRRPGQPAAGPLGPRGEQP